jgi:cytochrome P450 family 6
MIKKNINLLELTDDDITAQALVFFVAGFETSSTTLSYAMLEMARLPSVQKKARKNIKDVLARHNGTLNYQALQEMHYLDWIIDGVPVPQSNSTRDVFNLIILLEALRMYPALPLLNRTTTKKYTISGTSITLEKGTAIVIPIRALQNDPQFFEKPKVFNPDRFADAEKTRSNQFNYMPFGEGPRQCIGKRANLMKLFIF